MTCDAASAIPEEMQAREYCDDVNRHFQAWTRRAKQRPTKNRKCHQPAEALIERTADTL
jgi:hypothetical protein